MEIKIIERLNTTNDYDFLDDYYHSTPDIREFLEKVYSDIIKGKKGVIDKLLKYIKKHPKVPAIKNYLTMAYFVTNRPEKAYEYNRKVVRKHPTYVFGIINLANEYLDHEKYEKVKEVLGKNFDIQQLDTRRDTFHEDEVMAYYLAVIRYLYGKESPDPDLAEKIFDELKKINPDHSKLEYIEELRREFLHNSIFDNILMTEHNENEFERSVEVIDRRSHLQTTKSPDFNFPDQIKALYENNLSISGDKIDDILSLDHDKLGDDLIKVLKDSIYRYDYFEELRFDKYFSDLYFSFPIHALFLLTKVKHEDTLDTIFEILRQDDDYMDFWFCNLNDFIFVVILNSLAKNELPVLLDFVKEPNVSAIHKSMITEMVNNIPYTQPERRNEIIEWGRDFLNYMIKNNDNPNILDANLLGFYISELYYLKPKELLFLIKRLYDLKAVDPTVCGTYDEVFENYNDEIGEIDPESGVNVKFDTVQELYDLNNEQWSPEFFEEDNYMDIEPFNDSNNATSTYLPQWLTDKKINRNDPCPCGSGKKYKKCCLNT
jgi:tetratricopeptide (TPR) repeat protein